MVELSFLQELLYNNHLYMDGSKLEKTGFEYTYPRLTQELLQEVSGIAKCGCGDQKWGGCVGGGGGGVYEGCRDNRAPRIQDSIKMQKCESELLQKVSYYECC